MPLHIALAQIDIAFGAPADNLAAVRALAATAAARGADVLVLPELWSTGYDLTRADELATALDAGLHNELAALAREQQIALVGSTLVRHQGQPTNMATVYAADGSLLASYAKLHLFRLMDEHRYLRAGAEPVVFAAPWGPTALAICYDLRFPELFRAYAVQGAALMLVPAEWPSVRIAHWRTLVQARAIENQCFVVATNRVGADPNNQFGGHSLVVDPWGQILVEGAETAELLFASLDLDMVQAVRQRIPIFADRRPDIYE
jgi:predicted amidohydrolase